MLLSNFAVYNAFLGVASGFGGLEIPITFQKRQIRATFFIFMQNF